jgi:hypothetical protein
MSVYRAVIAAREAIDDPACPLTLRARALWQYLASCVDRDGTCYVGMPTLCTALGGVERTTIKRARAELVAYGAVVVDVEAHGRGRLNTYRLVLAAVRETVHPRTVSPVGNGAPTHRLPGENGAETVHLSTAYIGEVGEVEKTHARDHDDEAAERARATYASYAAGMRAMGATPLPPQAYWLTHAADDPDLWAESG